MFESLTQRARGLDPVRKKNLWLLLVVVSLVGLACASLFAFQFSLRALEMNAQALARSTQFTLTAAVQASDLLADTLANDPSLQALLAATDPALAGPVGDRLEDLRKQGRLEEIFVMDSQGTVVASSNWRQRGSFVGENYGFRPYFKQALSLGEGAFLALGVTSRRVGLYLSRPVGGGLGVLVVKMGFDPLERTLTTDSSVQFHHYLLADNQGVVFASSVPGWRFHSLAPLSPAVRDEIDRNRQYDGEPLPSLNLSADRDGIYASLWPFSGMTLPGDSRSYRLHLTRLPPFGWSLVVLLPTRSVLPVFWSVFGPALTLFLMMILVFSYFLGEQGRVERVVERDPLTGLISRRQMLRLIPPQLRAGVAMTLILLDIDGFHRVNDEYGQLEGDRILKEIGQQLLALTREQDLCVRYGGDEFALFLPVTVEVDSRILARQLLRALAHIRRPDTLCCNLVATLGVTETHPGDTLDTLIQRAEGLLASGKRLGGARTMFDPRMEGVGSRVDVDRDRASACRRAL